MKVDNSVVDLFEVTPNNGYFLLCNPRIIFGIPVSKKVGNLFLCKWAAYAPPTSCHVNCSQAAQLRPVKVLHPGHGHI
jgi:hypothetical protein